MWKMCDILLSQPQTAITSLGFSHACWLTYTATQQYLTLKHSLATYFLQWKTVSIVFLNTIPAASHLSLIIKIICVMIQYRHRLYAHSYMLVWDQKTQPILTASMKNTTIILSLMYNDQFVVYSSSSNSGYRLNHIVHRDRVLSVFQHHYLPS